MNNTDSLVFNVDSEHDGIRLVVTGLFLLVTIIAFFVINWLIPASSLNLIAIIGALVIAGGVTYIVEQQLTRRWPSGRTLKITDEAVIVQNKAVEQQRITISPETYRLYWRFRINKRTRVPKGWHMMAVALEHNEEYIAVYTLVSPETYQQLNKNDRFTELQKLSTDGNTAADMRVAGQQKRLHRAEAHRWREGLEMSNDDFSNYIAQIERRF